MPDITLSHLQKIIIGSQIVGTDSPESIHIHSAGSLEDSSEGFLSFVASKAYLSAGKKSKAQVLIVPPDLEKELPNRALLLYEKPEYGMAQALYALYPEPEATGFRSPHSFVHPTATIGKNVYLGHFVSVGARSVIGDNSILQDGVKVFEDVKIGEGARVGANCVIFSGTEIGKRFRSYGNSTIGADGFGFTFAEGRHNKIPQIGRVMIGDDVEIGSNAAIDRGALTDTVIGDGCKFDNHVQIAHNCKLGKHVIVAGSSGLAGSVTVEDGVIIAGGCCVSDHLHLQSGTVLAGGSSLRNSPKKPDVYVGWDLGLTFAEFQKYRVNAKSIIHLNKWFKRIKDIEGKLGIEVPDP